MSKILALSIIAIVQVLNFSQKAEASVLANCDAAWTGSSFQWYTDCSLWVTNEPLIVGATDIRMTVNYYASLYLGSNYIGSANLWDSEEDELNITQDSGGAWLMHGSIDVRALANKYQSGTNTPITYSPICISMFNEYYQLGTGWIYVPEFDRDDCNTVTAPPLP